MQQRPPSLLGAAGVQAADALIVLAASVLAGVDTVAGQSYQRGSGIALTLIGLATAAALAWVAVGLSRARRWSRTPAALTQLFVGIVGIYLVQGHRYEWGIPSLLLAAAGFALLLMPASLRALAGPRRHGGGPAPQPAAGQDAAPKPADRDRPKRGRAKTAPASQGRGQARPQANAPPAASSPARRGRRRLARRPGTSPREAGPAVVRRSPPGRRSSPAAAAADVHTGAGKLGVRGSAPG